MNYSIVKNHPDCNGWAIVNDSNELHGCYKSEKEAKDALAKMNKNNDGNRANDNNNNNDNNQQINHESILVEAADGTYRPPQGVISAAKRALKWISEGKAGPGFTDTGRKRAVQLAAGGPVSRETVARMKSYFARHAVDKQATGFNSGEKGFPSAGRVAWDAWGGDAGRTWVNRINLEAKK